MVGEVNWGLIDTSLPQKYAQPFARGQANRLALEQAQQERDMNALALQAKRQQISDENALRSIYAQSGGDMGKVAAGMRQAGLYEPAMKIEGQIAGQQEAQRAARIKQARDHLDLIKGVSIDIAANPTLENAMAKLQFVGDATGQDITNEAANLQSLGNNPEAIKQWALSHAATIDNVMPKFHEAVLGGETQRGTIDPLTGQFTVRETVKRTLTPAEIAADKRAAATLAQSERHFKEQQGLEREKMAATTGTGKPLTEAQAKATTYASQMQSASNEIDKIEGSGFSPTSLKSQIAVGMAGGLTNVLAPKEAQQYKQAQEQWAESFLRAKTGAAATKEEVELNRKTFFPQTGDSPAVVEQKRRARAQAERDVLTMSGPGARLATKRESAHPSDIQDLLNKYGD